MMGFLSFGNLRNHSSLKAVFSSLVDFDSDLLKKQMEVNPHLKDLLLTEGKDLPENYRYLMSEEMSNWKNCTLYDLITTFHGEKGETLFSKFSMSGENLTGWVAYTVGVDSKGRDIVTNIKMFSFDVSRPNPVLLRDLKNLVFDLMEDYAEVRWVAMKANPANRIYKSFVDDVGGQITDLGNLLVYQV